MATSISAILVPCLKSFNQLQERVEQPNYSYEGEVPSALWRDELGRLRVWAANIGAHQTGQSSLEFRLRDASHISRQIMKLLRDLDQTLSDIINELSEDGTKAFEDDQLSTVWLDDNPSTELQQLHEEFVNILDCLYQMSMLIRKPAHHDLLVVSRMGDKAEFEFYDLEHVRNLHPGAEEQINQRLGRAITRRRRYLSYRERHHRKLEKGIEEAQGIQRTTTETVISETIATDFKSHNIDFEEKSSNSGMSQTSYAPSLVDGGRVTIPPPPRESAAGKPFECPYCFFVIDAKSIRSWTRHIFKDIKPYVCTLTDCSQPDRLYDSRCEWFAHETTEHYRDGFVCALCKDNLNSSKPYGRHVAWHLEELALFALPRNEMEDAEDDDNENIAMASSSENHVAMDSQSSGSSVEENEQQLYEIQEIENKDAKDHQASDMQVGTIDSKMEKKAGDYFEVQQQQREGNDAGSPVSYGVGEIPDLGIDESDTSNQNGEWPSEDESRYEDLEQAHNPRRGRPRRKKVFSPEPFLAELEEKEKEDIAREMYEEE